MIDNKTLEQPSESVSTLKTLFDRSLAILAEENNGKTSQQRETDREKRIVKKDIVLRPQLPIHIDPVSLQKRAIDDAARALTSLWKISKPGHGSLSNRSLSTRSLSRGGLTNRALPCAR
jgi:hypothetical protein